eukprot:EG_transcript_27370
MAIAVVSWLQNRVGCNILGDIPETPEEVAKVTSLKDIGRIAHRIASLKEDLNGFLTDSEARLEKGDHAPTVQELQDMKSLYEQQTDVFTKQMFQLDSIMGDDEVREKRKHCITEIQVVLKDIESMLKVVQQCLDAPAVPDPEVIRRRLSTLSIHDAPATLDPQVAKSGKKVSKKD